MILNYHICFDLPVENAQSYFHFNLISSVIFSPTNCLPIFYISSFLLSFIFSIIHSFTYSFLHSFLIYLSQNMFWLFLYPINLQIFLCNSIFLPGSPEPKVYGKICFLLYFTVWQSYLYATCTPINTLNLGFHIFCH